MSHTACQCTRWPEKCWASHTGTRGLCAVCMPGTCQRPALVANGDVGITHRGPAASWPARSSTQPADRAAGPRGHVF